MNHNKLLHGPSAHAGADFIRFEFLVFAALLAAFLRSSLYGAVTPKHTPLTLR